MLFKIICVIALIYIVHRICDAMETVAKEYNEKINDGWIDYNTGKAFRA